MWNANHPNTIDTYTTFNTAFPKNPKKCKINNNHKTIYQLYKKYDTLQGIPDTSLSGSKLPRSVLDAIYNSYDLTQKGRTLQNVRDDLKKAAPNKKCTYCGIGTPNTLDHYLPRSTYKIFSIHTHNLIPVCQECNRKKDTLASTNACEQFLHAYFHQLPESTVLYAKLHVLNPGFFFEFSILGGNPQWEKTISRVKFQFSFLNLNSDFQEEATTFMFDNRVAFEGFFSTDKLNDHLAQNYLRAIQGYGINHWKTAIWRSLLQSEDFYKNGPSALYT